MKRSQESARRGGGGGERQGGAKKLPCLSPLHPKFPWKPTACRMTYCKSSIMPHGGLISRGGGGLFNLEKTMASVLHKELEFKVEKF